MRYSDFKKKIAMQFLLILSINCSSEKIQIDKLEGIGKLSLFIKMERNLFQNYLNQFLTIIKFNIRKDS